VKKYYFYLRNLGVNKTIFLGSIATSVILIIYAVVLALQ